MKREFVHLPLFEARIKKLKNHKELEREIENQILENPKVGDTISGTGGVRKFRYADSLRGKGKRGGYRILYFDLTDSEITFLLLIYNKDEADDISSDGKKMIKSLVEKLKEAYGGKK